ncbi:MAG TPA: ATP-binding cassette domain-containing protein [Solirubrobacteraceae bacterium]|jgi:ABC-2 type transport system ATP-binding protein
MYDNGVHDTITAGDGVRAENLGKRYGDLWALQGLDLVVAPGTVLGLLGHNGAGKTTTIRILATLAAPTTGQAWVGGLDVVRDAPRVRSNIGLTAQHATVDELLSARANLEMVALLYHLPKARARERADELLTRLGLAPDADRLVRTYSGGMRRRLDLAASLIADPAVLFLDEPTTGLDPQARTEIWSLIGELVGAGTTLILTTQYLEEADKTADQIVVLDGGHVVAAGTPAELKARVGGQRIAVTLDDPVSLPAVASALEPFADGPVSTDSERGEARAPIRPGTRIVEVVRALDAAGIDPADVQRRDATLDDVFLTLTNGHTAAAAAEVSP